MPQIKSILFPTDFSDYSNKAFPYAAGLAKEFGAKLVLLHAEEFLEADPANPLHSFEALKTFEGEIETEKVIIRGYSPAKHIIEIARQKECDLIVMATHGRSALAQFFLGGSVAEEVACYSPVPVFIVKVEPGYPPDRYACNLQKILFPTDFSESAGKAFAHALSLAEKFQAKLHVLHVIDDHSMAFYRSLGLEGEREDLRNRVLEFLTRHVSELGDQTRVAAIEVTEGRADGEIVRYAESKGMDLIAIATKGRTGLQEEILGSITDRVIRKAHCPVLTVRG